MKLSITFRHINATAAIKDYVDEKLGRLQRYVSQPLDAQVVLSLDRHLHVADATLAAGSRVFKGRAESNDMYASIDDAADKIERQIRKVKGQQRARNKHGVHLAAALDGREPTADATAAETAPAPRVRERGADGAPAVAARTRGAKP